MSVQIDLYRYFFWNTRTLTGVCISFSSFKWIFSFSLFLIWFWIVNHTRQFVRLINSIWAITILIAFESYVHFAIIICFLVELYAFDSTGFEIDITTGSLIFLFLLSKWAPFCTETSALAAVELFFVESFQVPLMFWLGWIDLV